MKVKMKKTKVMVFGLEEAPNSRIDPYCVCGGRVMANPVLCTICEK